MKPERITTVLDLAAFLLIAVFAAMALWVVWPPLAAAGAAMVLLGASWLIDRRVEAVEGEDL